MTARTILAFHVLESYAYWVHLTVKLKISFFIFTPAAASTDQKM